MLRIFSAALLTVALCAASAEALDIRFAPSAQLTLNPAYPPRGLADVYAQMVAIRSGPAEHLKIDRVRFELLQKGQVIATRVYSGDEALARSQGFMEAPAPLRGLQFLDPQGLAGWFGPDVEPATSTTLGPDQALLEPDVYFAVDGAPDQMRVVVRAQGPAGVKDIEAVIPVRAYRSPIDYRFPLKGAWLEASLPTAQSHHRWNSPTEFAVDFFKVDADGATFHDGSAEASHWYAFGEPVLAAADGEVVRVTGDRVQDRTFLAQRPGETAGQRGERVGREVETRALADFPNNLLGNIIVIRHQVGDTIEYSSYDHLKTGSAKVKVGDRVKAGDQIAEVGDTGDTPVVHLHFEVNAGPDPLYSPSLPFHLSGMERTGSTQDPGWFVRSK